MSQHPQEDARPALSPRQRVARQRARALLRLGRAGAIVVRRQDGAGSGQADRPETIAGPGRRSA